MTQVTRERVLDIPSDAGLTPQQEQRILPLPYPVEFHRWRASSADTAEKGTS